MLRDVFLLLWSLLLLNVILLENYDVQNDVNWTTVNFAFLISFAAQQPKSNRE